MAASVNGDGGDQNGDSTLHRASGAVILDWARRKLSVQVANLQQLAEHLVASGHVTGLAADAFNQLAASRRPPLSGQRGSVVTNGTEVTGDAKKRELNAQLKLKICEHQQQNAGLGQGQGQPVGGESLDVATTGGRKTPIVVTSRPFISNVKETNIKAKGVTAVQHQQQVKPLTPQKLILPKAPIAGDVNSATKVSPPKAAAALVAPPSVAAAAASLLLMNGLPSSVLLLSPMTGHVEALTPVSAAAAGTGNRLISEVNLASLPSLGKQHAAVVNGRFVTGADNSLQPQQQQVRPAVSISKQASASMANGRVSTNVLRPTTGRPRVADLLRESQGHGSSHTTEDQQRRVSTMLREKRNNADPNNLVFGKRSVSATPTLNIIRPKSLEADGDPLSKVPRPVAVLQSIANFSADSVVTPAASSLSRPILNTLLSPIPASINDQHQQHVAIATPKIAISGQKVAAVSNNGGGLNALSCLGDGNGGVVAYITTEELARLANANVLRNIDMSCPPTSAECRTWLLAGGGTANGKVNAGIATATDGKATANSSSAHSVTPHSELTSPLPNVRSTPSVSSASAEGNSLLRGLLSQKQPASSTPSSTGNNNNNGTGSANSKLSPKAGTVGVEALVSPRRPKIALRAVANGTPTATSAASVISPRSAGGDFVPIQFLETTSSVGTAAVRPKVVADTILPTLAFNDLKQLNTVRLTSAGLVAGQSAETVASQAANDLSSLLGGYSQTPIVFMPSTDGSFVPYELVQQSVVSDSNKAGGGGLKRAKLELNIDPNSLTLSKRKRRQTAGDPAVNAGDLSADLFGTNGSSAVFATNGLGNGQPIQNVLTLAEVNSFASQDNSGDSLESPFSPEMESIMSRNNRMDQWVELQQHQSQHAPFLFRSHSVPSAYGTLPSASTRTSTAMDALALSSAQDDDQEEFMDAVAAANVFGDDEGISVDPYLARRNLTHFLDDSTTSQHGSGDSSTLNHYLIRGDHLISGGAAIPSFMPAFRASATAPPPLPVLDPPPADLPVMADYELLQELDNGSADRDVFGVESSVIDTPSSLDTAATHGSLDNGSINAYYNDVALGQELDDYDLS